VADAATLRILIAEDNEDIASSMKMLLESSGYEVHTVGTGEAAVGAASVIRPQVILMDIGLPGLSGYGAARRIRTENPDLQVRIIALTGLGHKVDRLRSAEAGIDHHMVKPPDIAALRQILDSTWAPGKE
jgi:DNA-binding response OmpR family regulator